MLCQRLVSPRQGRVEACGLSSSALHLFFKETAHLLFVIRLQHESHQAVQLRSGQLFQAGKAQHLLGLIAEGVSLVVQASAQMYGFQQFFRQRHGHASFSHSRAFSVSANCSSEERW